MRIAIELNAIQERYPESIQELLTNLKNSSSKDKLADINLLKWHFDYGHVIKGLSFAEIKAGKKVSNPNDIIDADARAAAWIKRIPSVMLRCSINRWWAYTKLPEIPKEVKDFELKCAKIAIEREKTSNPLTEKEMKELIAEGLIVLKAG